MVPRIPVSKVLILLMKERKTEKSKTKAMQSFQDTRRFFALFEIFIENVVLKPPYQPKIFLSGPTSTSPITFFTGTGFGTSFFIRLHRSQQIDSVFSLLTKASLVKL